MARAGSIEVDIRANSAQFVREMRNTRRSVQATERRIQSFARVARTSLAFFGVAGGVSLAKDILNTANALNDFSNRLGVASEELQAWQLIGERAGVGTNQLNLGIQRLTRRSAEAAVGMGEARGALRELRIDAEDFNALSLDERMLELARAFEQVEDPATQLRLAFKLFDSEGTAMLQFLRDGEEGLRRMREELDDQLWSEEQTERMAVANTRLKEMSQSFRLLTGSVVDFAIRAYENLRAGFSGEAPAGSYQAAVDALRNRPLSDFGQDEVPAPPGVPVGRVYRGLEGTTGIARPGFNPDLSGITSAQLGGVEQVREYFRTINEGNQVRLDFEMEYWDEVRRLSADANDRLLAENNARLEQQRLLAEQTRQLFQDTFADSLVTAANQGFEAVFAMWVQLLQRMAAEQLASSLFGALSGAGGGGGFLSAIFGGGGDAAVAQNNVRGLP